MTAGSNVAAMVEALVEALGRENVLHEKEAMVPYSADATAGFRQAPAAVAFPRSALEVSSVLRIARAHKTQVVTRGAGTGLSGGCVPSLGSIVLCLARMDRILEIDLQNFTLRAQAGVITQAIHDAADAAGLFYPPDPGSMKQSTIGGNVAENAGGLHGLKYGVTGDYVMGLEVVLADGQVCSLGNKCVKDVAGYDLKRLFVGSEGTLGIVTEVLLRLIPKAAAKRTLMATFAQMDTAADAVSAVLAAKIVPCTMEFMDARTIRAVSEHTGATLPLDAAAMLLIEVDGHPARVEDEAKVIESCCRRYGATKIEVAVGAAEAEKLMAARRTAFTALAAAAPTAILDDATVPRSQLGKMIRFIQATAEKHKVEIATFGHFGDGNLHPTFLADPGKTDEIWRVEMAKKDIFAFALSLGGSITGEHGIGLAKKRFLRSQVGDVAYAALQSLKRSFDPDSILNPATMLER
jgi:glycolate oxidase